MKQRYSAHTFSDLETAPFCTDTYSLLKYGHDNSAKLLGVELANKFFNENSAILLSNRIVVIPSPYNIIENAATIMTKHFINRLNYLLVTSNGEHVDLSFIHRKVSYTNDYGNLDKETREKLLNNDEFYINEEFVKDKLIIFVDDIFITGTHENKLRQILFDNELHNDCFFLYYAVYTGNEPEIEGILNTKSIRDVYSLSKIMSIPDYNLIIRPIKHILRLSEKDFVYLMDNIPGHLIEKLLHACLAEGYYKIPQFQKNFQKLLTWYS